MPRHSSPIGLGQSRCRRSRSRATDTGDCSFIADRDLPVHSFSSNPGRRLSGVSPARPLACLVVKSRLGDGRMTSPTERPPVRHSTPGRSSKMSQVIELNVSSSGACAIFSLLHTHSDEDVDF
jgi:hypothetical protein